MNFSTYPTLVWSGRTDLTLFLCSLTVAPDAGVTFVASLRSTKAFLLLTARLPKSKRTCCEQNLLTPPPAVVNTRSSLYGLFPLLATGCKWWWLEGWANPTDYQCKDRPAGWNRTAALHTQGLISRLQSNPRFRSRPVICPLSPRQIVSATCAPSPIPPPPTCGWLIRPRSKASRWGAVRPE